MGTGSSKKKFEDRQIVTEEPIVYDPDKVKAQAEPPPIPDEAFHGHAPQVQSLNVASNPESDHPSAPSLPQSSSMGLLADAAQRAPRANYTIDEFDLVYHLGDGSYSEVIFAKHKDFPDGVALKIMSKQLLAREKKVEAAKRERNILDRMDHPGVVSLLFTFQDAQSLYMGLTPLMGGELYDQIRLKGVLSEEDLRVYAADIVDILGYLRSEGVIFRDLKPENLLVSPSGHLTLCDFGSATEDLPLPTTTTVDNTDASRAESGLTAGRSGQGEGAPKAGGKGARRGSFVGTADYVPPESLEKGELTPAWDLWSLGCIIYQMYTGGPPFRGETEYLTFLKIKEGKFTPPPQASSEGAALLKSLLVPDPSKRLGASSIDELKAHPFFKSIDWAKLRSAPAPEPVPMERRPVDNLWKLKLGFAAQRAIYGRGVQLPPSQNVVGPSITYVMNDD